MTVFGGGGGMRKNEDWVGGMVIRNSKNSTSPPYLVKNERSLKLQQRGIRNVHQPRF